MRHLLVTIALLAAMCCSKRTDADLHAAAVVRLRMDPAISSYPIDVIVTSGVARLAGETDTRVEQQRAVDVVKSVEGITSVVSELALSDRAIENDVERALAAEPMLAGLRIDVSVYRGVVRLEGSGTDRFQRARAVGTTAQIDGVVKVDDYMR